MLPHPRCFRPVQLGASRLGSGFMVAGRGLVFARLPSGLSIVSTLSSTWHLRFALVRRVAGGDLVFALGTPDIAGRISFEHPSCDGRPTS